MVPVPAGLASNELVVAPESNSRWRVTEYHTTSERIPVAGLYPRFQVTTLIWPRVYELLGLFFVAARFDFASLRFWVKVPLLLEFGSPFSEPGLPLLPMCSASSSKLAFRIVRAADLFLYDHFSKNSAGGAVSRCNPDQARLFGSFLSHYL